MEEKKQPEYHLIGTVVRDGVVYARIADAHLVGGLAGVEELRRRLAKENGAARAFNNLSAGGMQLRGGVHEYTLEQCEGPLLERWTGTSNEQVIRLSIQRIHERLEREARVPVSAIKTAPKHGMAGV